MKYIESGEMSGVGKAAALMAILGERAAGQVLKNLSEEEVQKVSQAIAELPQLASGEAERILEEYRQMLLAQQYVIKGGMDYAQSMLFSAFGPDVASRLLERLRERMAAEVANFDALRKADPQQLAKFIHSEHPQTIALVLSHLNSTQAASLLFSLPQDLRTDVAMRMAHMDQISPDIINKISAVIEQKLKTLGEFNRESYGGVKAVAEMINRLDTNVGKEILGTIESQDIKLFETIRHLMFVFEDLIQLDVRDLKELIQKVDKKQLTLAMKGTSEQLKNRIFGVLSQRNADMLREDIDVVGAVKIREVEAAQQHIIALIREMEKAGTLTLQKSEYVV
ncbi:MAG: flagellar motor switch protein FliG [Bryobacteraceae bacterium]|nr:flagellar motor switch protein FliG [Bryobacteraceae bacterium]